MIQCMGGWCRKREGCAHYVAARSIDQPSERLCAKGLDDPEPVRYEPKPKAPTPQPQEVPA